VSCGEGARPTEEEKKPRPESEGGKKDYELQGARERKMRISLRKGSGACDRWKERR